MLVVVSLPTLGLLFMKNKQVQTTLTEYITKDLSRKFQAKISVSAVNYSFFKRLQLHDFYMEDQWGDTLMYAEICNARIRTFRPDKQQVSFKKITFDNALFQIIMNAEQESSIQFFADSLRSEKPPEEKVNLDIDQIQFINSRFKRIDAFRPSPEYGVDFTNLDIRNVDFEVEDFRFRQDTTFFSVTRASGRDISGFIIDDVEFDMSFSKQFMTFSEGVVNTLFSTVRVPVIEFRYNDPRDMKQIFDSVDMYISSANSWLDFADIEYFFPQVRELTGRINLNGAIFGRFGDFRGENIYVDYMDHTRLEFDMHLAGLPSIDSLYMDFDFREFRTIPSELRNLAIAYDLGVLQDTLLYAGLTEMRYRGDFRGYKNNFETNGIFSSNVGNITVDLNMRPESERTLRFKGDMQSNGFDVGQLVGRESKVGKLVFNVALDGVNQDGNLDAIASGTLDTLGLFGYDYSNIQLEGAFTNRKFDGSFFIKDPNIDLTFSGRIDFEEEIPSFDFTADVAKLRPYYLNLRDDDPEYFASFQLETNMRGNRIGNLNGSIQLVDSHFRRTGSEIKMENISLETGNSKDTSFINLWSDELSAGILGRYDLLQLPGTFTGLLNDHFELFNTNETAGDSIAFFDFFVNIGDVNPILDFFFPRFNVEPGLTLEGHYDRQPDEYVFSCDGYFPMFSYSLLHMDDMAFSIQSDTTELSFQLAGTSLYSNEGFTILAPEVDLRFRNNRNDLFVHWDNETQPRYSGDIVTSGSISNNDSLGRIFRMQLQPSNFYYDNKKFVLPQSYFSIQPGSIVADSIYILGSDQYLFANGRYSTSPEDSITLNINHLNIHMLNDLFNALPLNLDGVLSGHTSVKNEHGNPLITSNLEAKDLAVNDQYFGTTTIRADWLRNEQELDMRVVNQSDSASSITLDGRFSPFSKSLDMRLDLSSINTRVLEPFTQGIFEEMEGTVDLDLGLAGTFTAPVVNGSVSLDNASAVVSRTRTRYNTSSAIRISDNDLFLDAFEITDEYGGRLTADGSVLTYDFSRFEFDIRLQANTFNFLSTTRFDNEQFYGDIYASAVASIRGPADQLQIRATANTEKFTNLKLPLYNPAQIQTTDFITFVQSEKSTQSTVPPENKQKNWFTLEMDLQINPNTSVQLIFDPKVGDIIEASGNGALSLNLDENGEFSMFGTVLIEEGEYLFTLQNIINKRFRVEPGGSIRWNGSPTSAVIDLEAVYETKASTYSLAPDPTDDMKKRIPVNCLLSLQGELKNPTIEPSIELPTAEPETRSVVETSIGTEEELMRQFISLLVINNFISSAEFGAAPLGGNSTGVAGVTASELLSNQLSNWLSQISNDFDIGVNYRPGDAISSDEVEVALSTQLLNDRIIFSGNLDVLGDEVKTPGGPSNIVGDFDLEFRVTDKVSVKAFNRVNDDRIVRPSLYTQGVGLVYRSEFNSIGDLFRKKENEPGDSQSSDVPEGEAIKEEETGHVSEN